MYGQPSAWLSAIVTGDTPRSERADILSRFKAHEIKYLVNVAVLTTGFDAPHVDVIALLRATESVGLMQQIIGRGLRISDGKQDCLLLDYAENFERHCPDGDVFAPEVTANSATGNKYIKCVCPLCNVENEFKARPNPDNYETNNHGYWVDLDGFAIPTEFGSMPSHFGRRCQGKLVVAGDMVQCGYRWTSKECPHCEGPNDIAARYCESCKGEIVNPNDKLRIEFQEMKRDPTNRQTDKVMSWTVKPSISRTGKQTERIDVVTPYRSFAFWLMRQPTWSRAARDRDLFLALGNVAPQTITYAKDPETGFYRVFAYNRLADEIPE